MQLVNPICAAAFPNIGTPIQWSNARQPYTSYLAFNKRGHVVGNVLKSHAAYASWRFISANGETRQSFSTKALLIQYLSTL